MDISASLPPVASPYTPAAAPSSAPAPAPDRVTVDEAPEPHSHRWIAPAALLAVSIVGLAGCGRQSVPPPPDTSQSQPSQPGDAISLADPKPAVSVFDGTRLDVIRQTETERDMDGKESTHDVALSPFGVDLGDGLFFDTNGNLSFELAPDMVIRAPQHVDYAQQAVFGSAAHTTLEQTASGTAIKSPVLFGKPAPYTITQSANGDVVMHQPVLGGTVDTTIHREGNVTTVSAPGLGGRYVVARIIDSGAHSEVHQPALGGDVVTRIDRAGGRITIQEPALFHPAVTTIDHKGADIKATYPGGSTTIHQVDPTHTTVEERGWGSAKATVTTDGDRITVQQPALFGRGATTTVTVQR